MDLPTFFLAVFFPHVAYHILAFNVVFPLAKPLFDRMTSLKAPTQSEIAQAAGSVVLTVLAWKLPHPACVVLTAVSAYLLPSLKPIKNRPTELLYQLARIMDTLQLLTAISGPCFDFLKFVVATIFGFLIEILPLTIRGLSWFIPNRLDHHASKVYLALELSANGTITMETRNGMIGTALLHLFLEALVFWLVTKMVMRGA